MVGDLTEMVRESTEYRTKSNRGEIATLRWGIWTESEYIADRRKVFSFFLFSRVRRRKVFYDSNKGVFYKDAVHNHVRYGAFV